MNPENKNCQNCKRNFSIESEDFVFYDKIKVPPPTFCVDCREQRRICFRNERMFYKHDCGLCGKSVVSRVSPDKPYPMYCNRCWWGDGWDPMDYGREYDFSRPFFEQWKELYFSVPHISMFNSNSVNSEWINQESDDKNCYLNVGGHYNEDSAYNTYELKGKNCFDNYWLLASDHAAHNINCERGYFLHYSAECHDCINTVLSYDCRNSQNIIGCAGLRNRQYCIFNEQYSKEDYEKFLRENPISSYTSLQSLKEKAMKIWNAAPHRENFIFKSIDTDGNYLAEAKNVHNCWNGTKLENCKHLFISGWMKDSYDCSSVGASELAYECGHSGGSYNSKGLLFCLSSDPLKKITINNVEYSAMTVSSNNCFGCVGVRGGDYMILNRKYSKEEYENLIPKIKAHMSDMPYVDKLGKIYKYGEFFPSELSPFGYNETTAQEYFPLTKDTALAQGFEWSDFETGTKYEFSEYLIPDDIKDIGDDILDKVLRCTETGKAYRIIPMELAFYRASGIPIPRTSPLARHNERMSRLLPRKLFDRNCQRCEKAIRTPYEPGRPEVVYCELCYQQEVL